VRFTRIAQIAGQTPGFKHTQGFNDEQLVDAVHCIGYFNFINRVLDALGVDPEPGMLYPREFA